VSGHLHAPADLPPGGKPPGTHWIGFWVGPRAGLDNVEKRKFLILPGLELRPPGRPPVASRYTDYAIPAPLTMAGVWNIWSFPELHVLRTQRSSSKHRGPFPNCLGREVHAPQHIEVDRQQHGPVSIASYRCARQITPSHQSHQSYLCGVGTCELTPFDLQCTRECWFWQRALCLGCLAMKSKIRLHKQLKYRNK
jgi:hypothetical protein